MARVVLVITGTFVKWLFTMRKYSISQVFEQNPPDAYIIGLIFYSVVGCLASIIYVLLK
jgi:hypothetical protein